MCCIDRMVDRLIDRLRAIASGAGTVESRLRSMLRERVLHRFDYARDHAASIDAMLGAVRPALLARRAKYFRAEAVVFEALLAEARQDRDPVATRKAIDAEALVTATNALLPYSLSPREPGNRKDLERRVDAVADLLVRGLHPSASGRPSRHPALTPKEPPMKRFAVAVAFTVLAVSTAHAQYHAPGETSRT